MNNPISSRLPENELKGTLALEAAHQSLNIYTQSKELKVTDDVVKIFTIANMMLQKGALDSVDNLKKHIEVVKILKTDAKIILSKFEDLMRKKNYQTAKKIDSKKYFEEEMSVKYLSTQFIRKINNFIKHYEFCEELIYKLKIISTIPLDTHNYEDIRDRCDEIFKELNKSDPSLAKSLENNKEMQALRDKFRILENELAKDDGLMVKTEKDTKEIPKEMALEIFDYLNVKDLVNLSQVSKQLHRIAGKSMLNPDLPAYKWAFSSPRVRELEESKSEKERIINYREGSEVGSLVKGKEKLFLNTYCRQNEPNLKEIENKVAKGEPLRKAMLSNLLLIADRGDPHSEIAVELLIKAKTTDELTSKAKLELLLFYLGRGSKAANDFFANGFEVGFKTDIYLQLDLKLDHPHMFALAKKMLARGVKHALPFVIKSYEQEWHNQKIKNPELAKTIIALLMEWGIKEDYFAIETLIKIHRDGLFGSKKDPDAAVEVAIKLSKVLENPFPFKALLKLFQDDPEWEYIAKAIAKDNITACIKLLEPQDRELTRFVIELAKQGIPSAIKASLQYFADLPIGLQLAKDYADNGDEYATAYLLKYYALGRFGLTSHDMKIRETAKKQALFYGWDTEVFDRKPFRTIDTIESTRKLAEHYIDRGSKAAKIWLEENPKKS